MENLELKKFIEDFLFSFNDYLTDSKNTKNNNCEQLVTISEKELKIDPELKNLKKELNKIKYDLIPTNYSKPLSVWKIIKL